MESESIVERVAKALWEAYRDSIPANAEIPHWEDVGEYGRKTYRAYARAAISAMREPTEEMRRAASFDQTDEDWRAMIDAALK